MQDSLWNENPIWQASLRFDVSQASDAEWAWAAGIFEGEGCVHYNVQGNRHIRILLMNMTDEDVIRRFRDVVGVGQVKSVKETPCRKKHWKPAWKWYVCNWPDVLLVAQMFRPWFGTRRRKKLDDMLSNPPRHPNAIRKMICKRGHPLTGPEALIYINPKHPKTKNCQWCRRVRGKASKLLMEREPDLAGAFETRELKAD